MDRNAKKKGLIFFACIAVLSFVGSFLTGGGGDGESVRVLMRDAVLHETNKISLFGIMDINPGLVSAYVVTAAILIAALCIRIFAVPRFKMVPGKLQSALEALVGFFDNLAKSSSPRINGFLGAYIFAAGVYIFVGTVFAPDINEFSSVRRAFERCACNGACLQRLVFKLRTAGCGRCALHAFARTHSGIRADNAYGSFLR